MRGPSAGAVKPSITRRFTLWLFEYPPFSPYVSTNVVIDFSKAQDYLQQLNAIEGVRITINDLMIGVVGRLYSEFPQANRRVIGRTIYQMDRVCVAAPVDLLDAGVQGLELSIALIEDADRRSLRHIAQQTGRTISQEKKGKPQHPLIRLLLPLAKRAPEGAFYSALSWMDRLGQSRLLSKYTHKLLPVSCVVSNPGAIYKDVPGGRFLGASMSPPAKVAPVGSIMGLSAIQDEVMAIDGKPQVRPAMPVIYVFDHRLFDGVMCGRILKRMTAMLQEPEALFGPTGEREGP